MTFKILQKTKTNRYDKSTTKLIKITKFTI